MTRTPSPRDSFFSFSTRFPPPFFLRRRDAPPPEAFKGGERERTRGDEKRAMSLSSRAGEAATRVGFVRACLSFRPLSFRELEMPKRVLFFEHTLRSSSFFSLWEGEKRRADRNARGRSRDDATKTRAKKRQSLNAYRFFRTISMQSSPFFVFARVATKASSEFYLPCGKRARFWRKKL